MIARDYEEPERIPGEEGWQWCDRYAARIPPDTFRKIMREAFRLRRRDIRRRFRLAPLWSYIGQASAYGSGVSGAIERRWNAIRDRFWQTAFDEPMEIPR